MKKKSVFFVSVLCALMSFVFTGCKDEDENQLTGSDRSCDWGHFYRHGSG